MALILMNQQSYRHYYRKVIAYGAIASLTITPAVSFSVPMGGSISDGVASINTHATGVVVNQSTDKAVIDWQGFDVGSGESAQFNVPNGNSFTLNRINSQTPSHIYGKVTSNGQLMLINRNGVVFGKGSQVDVNGLVATTSDISNQDFMAGKNNFRSGGNPNASVENHGTITIRNGGSAALVAPNVKNSGTINANFGKVSLAAGDTFTIDPYGDGLVQLAVPEHMARGMVENSGTINANGGKVQLAASLDEVTDSLINLNGAINADNGKVDIKGGVIDQTGKISAKHGAVKITGNKISEQGQVIADNGSIDINFKKAYIDSAQAKVSVSGNKAGNISVKGEKGSTLFASGTYDASSSTGKGGTIKATASDIKLYAATMDASGRTGGGTIHIGGGFQGSGDLMHADTTSINPYTTLKADTTTSGKGGEVVVWSDKETRFGGNASAKGGLLGDGGMIEVSSKDTLNLSGTTDVSSIFGKPGSILLDPKNIIISTTGQSYPTYELIDPSFSAGNGFGQQILALGNGNVVIKAALDDFAAADAGAVYLYNGTTGALISTLRGSTANDNIGQNSSFQGLQALTGNNNFVIRSTNWDNVATANAGAVTWGSGTLGVSGSVSAVNSLVGMQANDNVGSGGLSVMVTVLTNGNYVVSSENWDNGATLNTGAVT
jgi:filamentous hemagglutinin family protein